MKLMNIYCCGCQKRVEAVLTDGTEIYPHRADLAPLPFWKCPTCKNYVGCHHKTTNPTWPLGNIPTPEIRNARKEIHALLDPLWKSGKFKRKEIYGKISERMGREFHTARIKTVDEAREAYRIIKELAA